MRCFHVPKTVDNDLMENDHTPGVPLCGSLRRHGLHGRLHGQHLPPGHQDQRRHGPPRRVPHGRQRARAPPRSHLNPHITGESTDGPQLIYLPEVAFDTDSVSSPMSRRSTRSKGRCHIAVSRGHLRTRDGTPIGARLIKGGQVDAHGNVQLSGSGALGDQLADSHQAEAHARRAASPPASAPTPSATSSAAGPTRRPSIGSRPGAADSSRLAWRWQGHQDGSVAIVRTGSGNVLLGGTEDYTSEYRRVELKAVAAKTKHMPPEFIEGTNNVRL
jgi:hypothetical protein